MNWDSLPQDEQMTRATAAQTKYGEDLMSKAHVQGTAIGLEKADGKYTSRVALVVLVDKKLPLEELAIKDQIPEELDGVPIDVQEVGVLSAQ